MLALASALGIGRFVYTPILPPMAEALGLSGRAAGLIASANFAGYLAGALLATVPHLPGGPRRWFVGGLVIGAATTIAMGAASHMAVFVALRFAGGAATAFVLVLGTASVLDGLARGGRLRLRWLHYAGVGVGIALSSVLVASLEALGASWRLLWLAAGAVAALMVPAPAVLLSWRAAGAGRPARRDADRLGRGLIPITICHFLFGFGYVVTATFLVAMVRSSSSGRALEPVVWLIVGLAAIPSTLVWDLAASRIGSRNAYALASLMQGAGVLAGGCWPSVPGALLAAACLGATIMGLTALGFSVARELGEQGQARRFAVITASFGLGQAIGPLVGGTLLDWTGGYGAGSALAAAGLLASCAVMLLTGRERNG